MKSILIERPGVVTYKEEEMPRREKGEALLRLLYGGICGSDLGTYRGTFAYADYPRIPGHEFSAEIVDIDKNELGLRAGMAVTANPYFNCGQCYSCRRGMVNCCERNETMGAQRDGAFSQYITMPIERLYKGDGLAPRHLALIEPFCIGYHGVKKAGIRAGEKVLVIGAGTIGITAAVSAKLSGAEVHICDIARAKLVYAERFGFDRYILSDDDLRDNIQEITNGDGYDVVVEAVGLPTTFQNAVDAAAYGGRMIQIGVGKSRVDFDFTILQKKELSLQGSRNALKEDFLAVIALAQQGKIDLESLITNIFPFGKGAEAFQQFDEKAGEMLKVLIEF